MWGIQWKVVGRLTEFINPSAFEEVIFNQYTELEKYSVSTSVTVGINMRLIKLSVGLEDIVNIGVDDRLQTGYFYSKTTAIYRKCQIWYFTNY